jgi:hypothetical protein
MNFQPNFYTYNVKMKKEDKKVYDSALSDYSIIIRNGGNSLDQIKDCIKVLEYFEDYEKCKDLLEILKAYQAKRNNSETGLNPDGKKTK